VVVPLIALALAGAPSWDALKPIEGSLLFACQSAPATGELYFKDDAGTVHRLTMTEPKQGAGLVTWYGNRILAVIDRGFRNRMEIRDLTTRPDAVGERLGFGYAPAVSPTGTIAYTRLGEGDHGRLFDEVVRLRRGKRKVLGHRNEIWGLYWVGHRRLLAFAKGRSGRFSLTSITGTRSVPLGKRAGNLTLSLRRRVAYSHAGRVTVMRLDGSHRRVFRSRWTPWTWSPDGRQILVSGRGRRVGVMNARTGKVRRLGELPCGYLTSAEWTPPGRHPWPGAPR
jgi:hypothetical protein